MKMYGSSVLSLIASSLCFYLLSNQTHAAPVELLKNGGFEEIKDGAPVAWEPSNCGKLTSAGDAKSGNYAAKFQTVEHAWGYCYFHTSIPVKTGATYRASIWARGTGTFGILFPQYSVNFFGSVFAPNWQLVPEWRKYDFVYKAEDPRILRVAFGVQLFGKDTVAFFDDASFTFDPTENPGVVWEDQKPPTKTLKVEVIPRQATTQLFLNGKEFPITAQVSTLEIQEGLCVIALKAKSTGDTPGIKVGFLGHPETDGRWRVGVEESDGWTNLDFNDGKWPVVELQT